MSIIKKRMTTRRFKVGDYVRCIEGHADVLINGNIYQVIYEAPPSRTDYKVKLKGMDTYGAWYEYRFESVPKEYNIKKILNAIDNG